MDLTAQLRGSLISQNLPLPSSTLLSTLITARTPPPPLASLVASARSRLLACDLSAGAAAGILDAALTSLPLGVDTPQAKEARLPRDVHVQVLDIEDLSASRWDQVLELEAVALGERTRGREIVRVVADGEDGEENAAQSQLRRQAAGGAGGGDGQDNSHAATAGVSSRSATHRLVLQDCKGKKVFGLELKRVDRLGVGRTAIGEKMLLRAGTVVARGVVLLAPESCVLLGGRVEAWHKAWVDGRLERLKEAAGAGSGDLR